MKITTALTALGMAAALVGAAAEANATAHAKCTMTGWTALFLNADNGGASPTQSARGRFDKGDFELEVDLFAGSTATAKVVNSAGNVVSNCTITDNSAGNGEVEKTCTSIVGATHFDVTVN